MSDYDNSQTWKNHKTPYKKSLKVQFSISQEAAEPSPKLLRIMSAAARTVWAGKLMIQKIVVYCFRTVKLWETRLCLLHEMQNTREVQHRLLGGKITLSLLKTLHPTLYSYC